MRLVFDTNVYVSAFFIPGSKSDAAFRLASRDAFDLFISPAILSELMGKLDEPRFGFAEARLDEVERVVLGAATLVHPEESLSVVEDEPDNRVLECAAAAGAAAIVTGDRHLLALKSYEGIGIMTVAELLYTFPRL